MKKQLLFVINHLTVGGIQKTLISALKVLDYDKYDVTVYLRKNRTDLLPLIDKRADVIINKDPNKYYRKPKALIIQALVEFNKLIGSKKKAEELQKKLVALVNSYCMNYERKTYFKDQKYDIAIAYANGYPAYFVADYIKADEKIIFFHTSTNDLPEIHIKFITKFLSHIFQNSFFLIDQRSIIGVKHFAPKITAKSGNLKPLIFYNTYKISASFLHISIIQG